MSAAAPTTTGIATLGILLVAALLITPPSAHAASGTTHLTVRLHLPEPPPQPTPLSAEVDQTTVDEVSSRLRAVVETAPKYAPMAERASGRDMVVWSHGSGWVLDDRQRAAMIATNHGVVSL